LGGAKWSLPIILGLTAISLSKDREKNFDSANLIGLFLFLACTSSLLYFYSFENGGGAIGRLIAEQSIPYVGPWITAALFSSGLIISLLLLLDTSVSRLVGEESIFFIIIGLLLGIIIYPFIRKTDGEKNKNEESDGNSSGEADEALPPKVDRHTSDLKEENGKVEVKEYDIEEEYDEKEENDLEGERAVNNKLGISEKKNGKSDQFGWEKSNLKINIPSDLLQNKPQKPVSGNTQKNQEIIRETLKDFGISVTMSDVTVGPTVTQYTFKPSKGISVNRVKALSDDLSLNLAVHPVRIEAPIPGKSFVGLEIPNQTKVLVSLKELIKSKIFNQRKSNTVIPMGRDVTGKIIMDDLVKMPHILVAGATNSGKSVFLHSLITSLMFQNNPDDLKFILIDQKQVELSLYNGMPYLVAPVITEHKRAIRALQWSIREMDKRLEIINNAHCQNIGDYNKKRERDSLPYLVIVVDELGDLLSTARKEAESAIIRLGQKSRASGIHLVLATQRPSVDILSGLIKANMPARAAFSVTSSVNSKTILDFTGAEKLIGQGDMLYINSSMSKPVRIQGAFVSKDEIKTIVKYTKKKAGKTSYEENFEKQSQPGFDFGGDNDEGDQMMEEARKMIVDTGKASATMLQTRLGIGYPRACRILDNLEKQGVVGPSIPNKPREVNIREREDK
jgi:S-DNA-T family DNA segregation ATPase FtsK/SpoIIIE